MEERPIFAIFQGGGAKGIAHVGAMKAAEENGFAIMAVAGTSAGAVIATLVAAGLDADKIFDPRNQNDNILRWFGKEPLDFFGKSNWDSFLCFWKGWRCLFDCRMWKVLWAVFRDRGYFHTEYIRKFVNDVLRWRLEQLYGAYSSHGSSWTVPDRVKFKDLDYTKFPREVLPLKIVATNMRTGGLAIFDQTLTPEIDVADAVVASLAIPGVFKPVTMLSDSKDGPFVDGGLVSNLPIWVFAEEKLEWEREYPEDPPIPIVGFSLAEMPRSDEPLSEINAFINFCKIIVDTVLSGSQTITRQFVEDLEVVKIETSFSMLDFDRPWPDFCMAYNEGKACAKDQLTSAMILKPDLVQEELEKIVEEVRANIDARRLTAMKPALKHYRGSLVQLAGQRTLRVKYAVNMKADADDRLILDERSNGAAAAYSSRGLAFQDFRDPKALDFMTKYEKALVRRDLFGAICVPIFEDKAEWSKGEKEPRNRPLGVFCFDSDEDIEVDYNDPAFKDFIVRRSTVLQAAMKD
jgi:NTE family protein